MSPPLPWRTDREERAKAEQVRSLTRDAVKAASIPPESSGFWGLEEDENGFTDVPRGAIKGLPWHPPEPDEYPAPHERWPWLHGA